MMKKVYVGMSGGVDSSLTAALLHEQGYDVTGVYMKNWTREIGGLPCPWRDDFRDAKKVAIQLGIPLKIFDFQKQYKQKVVDYMIAEYRAGRTPNPDIMCNQEIKFKLFLDTALEDGADLIATGHYARLRRERSSTQSGTGAGTDLAPKLLMAKDKKKDQSYFLYRVSSEALAKTLFPIGEFASKTAVRAAAQKRGLVTAAKPDSQGICFVGEVGIRDFISEFIKTKPGPIIDTAGKILGQHDGAIFFTPGQRHGLDIGGGLPYYVTKIDAAKNTVYVSDHLDEPEFWSKDIKIGQLHWINQTPKSNKNYHFRTRHRGELLPGTIKVGQKTAAIGFNSSQRSLASGQSIVVYDGQTCLGGGIIA